MNQGAGLYIHVPFCLSKCPYCGFVSRRAPVSVQRSYVDSLRREMDSLVPLCREFSLVFDTLYVGGGTPTSIPPEALCKLVDHALGTFEWGAGVREITIEANPGTVTPEDLAWLRHRGVKRLSLGLQALSTRGLEVLGRRHGVAQGIRAFHAARNAGMRVSVDLIYGWPGQDGQEWGRTLEILTLLRPEHVSCYELTLEEGTPMQKMAASGSLCLPGEAAVLRFWDMVDEILGPHGYRHYEISNYALDGMECVHNLKYWTGLPYLGVGCSAASYVPPARWTNSSDIDAYMNLVDAGMSAIVHREVLCRDARVREAMVLSLRLVRGVDRASFRHRWGVDPVEFYGDLLRRLEDQDLVRIDKERVRLSARGLRLANTVMAELV